MEVNQMLVNAIARYQGELELIAEIEEEPLNKTCWTIMLIGFERLGKGEESFTLTLPFVLNAESILNPDVGVVIEPLIEDLATELGMPDQMVVNYIFSEGLVVALQSE